MDFSKLAKKRPAPVLTRANWRRWFEIMETYFEGERLGYVLRQTEMEYAFIRPGFGSGSHTPMSDNENDPLNAGRVWNTEKRAEYCAAAAKVRYILTICIDDFDAEFIREFDSTKQKWDQLRAKYSRTRPVTLQEDMAKLTGFRLEKGITINQAWV